MYFEVEVPPSPEVVAAAPSASSALCQHHLVLAPFCSPPLISFEDVLLGDKVTTTLHISNPKPATAQIFIQKYPEVNINFSWSEISINTNETAILEISWCPEKVLSQRTTVQIAEKRKGKYDIIIILKSICKSKKPVKKVTRQLKVKKSPLKMPKPKSPKQRSALHAAGIKAKENLLKSNSMFDNFQHPTKPRPQVKTSQFQMYDLELSPKFNSVTTFSHFSCEESIYNLKNYEEIRRDTYLIESNEKMDKENIWNNVTTPIKKKKSESRINHDISVLTAIENMEFTPIKGFNSNHQNKHDKLNGNHTNKKIMSENIDPSYSILEIENSIENINTRGVILKNNNITHPVINLVDCSTISNISVLETNESKNTFLTNKNIFMNEMEKINKESSPKIIVNHCIDDSLFKTPKNLFNNSIEEFQPNRFSTELKVNNLLPGLQSLNDEYVGNFANENTTPNSTFRRLSSETYTKGDSPIIPIDPDNMEYLHSSPYSTDRSPLSSMSDFGIKHNNLGILPINDNIKNYNERAFFRNNIREKNNHNTARSVIEANLWQKSPPRSVSPMPLFSIPEEPSMTFADKTTNEVNFKAPFETFILNKTFDKINTVPKPPINNGWKKIAVNRDVKVSKVTHSENIETSDNFTTMTYIDVYSAAATVNPFIESSVAYLYDEKAISKLELEFKKWLNYLLTPPSDLDSKLDIDIGKTWIENRSKSVPVAPTREQVSSKYHTNHRLESLRKSANVLMSTFQTSQVFLKVSNQVEKKILSIRADKSLHVDVGLQKTILSILLCYNPLWLRIGLEAIHSKTITLTSNDDVCGLSEFIIDNVFKIPHITPKQLLIQPTHVELIKKNTLKKVLFLIYFLDQAKEKKIIFHDPCLFCRNAPFKESKQILFQFTKELLSGVGDITRHLRPTGYIVSHKQTYLHEFKYAVHNIAVDLKDGIRLTRLMEIILMKENLTLNLRTPAISRLQKVHNVQIALSALKNANFDILGDITAKDIADGHREKTLSLLWQLINKFRAPLFEKSAVLIQKWWRRNYLAIWIRNQITKKRLLKGNNAAITIQTWWREIKYKRDARVKKEIETRACIVIQSYWRMWCVKHEYQKLKSSTTIIQKHIRNYLIISRAKNTLNDLRRNYAACNIQKWFRKYQLYNYTRRNNSDHDYYVILKGSVINVQRLYRANALMKIARNDYINKKNSAIKIQRFYRSVILMRNMRNEYLQKKSAAITIQRKFRANKLMQLQKREFEIKYNAIVTIQKFHRSIILMRNLRNEYLQKKSAAITLQRKFRANKMMLHYKQEYAIKYNAIIKIQQFYRSVIVMRNLRDDYLRKKSAAITLQRKFRANKIMLKHRNEYKIKYIAIVTIQRFYRNYSIAKKTQDEYRNLLSATIYIQKLYRAKLQMRMERKNYIEMKKSAIVIQKFYRSLIVTRNMRKKYLELKSAAIVIQRKFRANKIMLKYRNDYVITYNAIVTIQRFYRNYSIAKKTQDDYRNLLSAAINLQRLYRAKLSMRIERNKYIEMKKSAIVIQHCYRNYRNNRRIVAANIIKNWYQNIKMRRELARNNTDCVTYKKLKYYTIYIQRMYRTKLAMKRERYSFITIKTNVIKIQRFYRSVVSSRCIRSEYLATKSATLFIQNRFRANKLMRQQRTEYVMKQQAAKTIQEFYRNYRLMKNARDYYLKLNSAVMFVQQHYRSKLIIKTHMQQLRTFKSSAIIIQRCYRKYIHEKKSSAAIIIQRWYRKILINQKYAKENVDVVYYAKLKASAIYIQAKYRANILMRKERNEYNTIRCSVIKIQQYYRSIRITRIIRKHYLTLRSTTIFIQNRVRANNSMSMCKNDYMKMKNSAIVIQRYFRNYVTTRQIRNEYLRLRSASILIQTTYRAMLSMRIERKLYVEKLHSAIIIQRCFRNYITDRRNVAATKIQLWYRKLKMINTDRDDFIKLKSCVKYIQTLHRANIAMKKDRNAFLNIKTNTVKIQQFYRNYVISKNVRNQYLHLKMATVLIQNRFRTKQILKLHKDEFLMRKSAVITIQRYFRNHLAMKTARNDYIKLRQSTIFMQRTYRAKILMNSERRCYHNKRNAVIKIQNFYRAYCEMKSLRNEYIAKRNAAIVIQNKYKTYHQKKQFDRLKNASIIIQRYYRSVLNDRKIRLEMEIEKSRKIEAALKIQSYWRGYNLRKEQNDNSKIKMLRQRWKQGGLESQQLTLAERNDDAINVLGSFRDIASIIRAFKTLDFVTNVYPMMYTTDGTGGRIAKSLIMYMGSTNRSVSALETLHLVVNILINMTRYSRTADYVYNNNNILTILQSMMRWCDKDSTLSCSFSTLLWLFGKYDKMRKQLSDFLIKTDQFKILSHIRQSILRKKKMNGHKRITRSMRVSLTPSKNKSINILPFTEPDYGISRSKKPKIFQDELEGIDHVYEMYGLPFFEMS